jgi:hypothetical protein
MHAEGANLLVSKSGDISAGIALSAGIPRSPLEVEFSILHAVR